ncbi:unnamed protein product [Bursaphelenchus xylophilus]|uniref:(pine wood nematode) hypothetical protein n=1 Tax=Bursaphelenchus xylophilus TaxID=6326 RepID=A0A1I7S613_BURXY|nr:unnamed protein product [Bursaphelenchus xylophilus]CAG9082402.1 unnamed protein product [Bursaphelenchus xylophilus]
MSLRPRRSIRAPQYLQDYVTPDRIKVEPESPKVTKSPGKQKKKVEESVEQKPADESIADVSTAKVAETVVAEVKAEVTPTKKKAVTRRSNAKKKKDEHIEPDQGESSKDLESSEPAAVQIEQPNIPAPDVSTPKIQAKPVETVVISDVTPPKRRYGTRRSMAQQRAEELEQTQVQEKVPEVPTAEVSTPTIEAEPVDATVDVVKPGSSKPKRKPARARASDQKSEEKMEVDETPPAEKVDVPTAEIETPTVQAKPVDEIAKESVKPEVNVSKRKYGTRRNVAEEKKEAQKVVEIESDKEDDIQVIEPPKKKGPKLILVSIDSTPVQQKQQDVPTAEVSTPTIQSKPVDETVETPKTQETSKSSSPPNSNKSDRRPILEKLVIRTKDLSGSPSPSPDPRKVSKDLQRKPSEIRKTSLTPSQAQLTPRGQITPGSGPPRKRTIPQRHAPAGIDLLDSILGSQDALLKECNKTDQEKAAELQKLELEKRRLSGQSPFLLGPIEKRPRTNTVSSDGSHSNSPVPGFNPKDPLNIMTIPSSPGSSGPSSATTESNTPKPSSSRPDDPPGVVIERSADRLKRLNQSIPLPGQRKASQASPLAISPGISSNEKFSTIVRVPLSPPKLVSPQDLPKIPKEESEKSTRKASRWDTSSTRASTTVPSPVVTSIPIQPAPSSFPNPFLPPPPMPGFPFPPPFPPPATLPCLPGVPGLPYPPPFGLPFHPNIPPPIVTPVMTAHQVPFSIHPPLPDLDSIPIPPAPPINNAGDAGFAPVSATICDEISKESESEIPTNHVDTPTIDEISSLNAEIGKTVDSSTESLRKLAQYEVEFGDEIPGVKYEVELKEEPEDVVKSVEDIVRSVVTAIVEEVAFEIEHAGTISATARMRLHDSLLHIDSEDVYEPDLVDENICEDDEDAPGTSQLHIDVDFEETEQPLTTNDSQEVDEEDEDEIAGEAESDSDFDSEEEEEEEDEVEVDEEGRVKQKSGSPKTHQVDIPKENGAPDQNPSESAIQALLKDPTQFLKRADILIKSINKNGMEIEQMELDEDYVVEEPEKPLPEFHGEPVPDEDDDDALFEMAAGLSRKKEDKPIEEERLPDDECIELDYYNADMNIKADPKNKWLVDPDNGDGFALMWGCVKSNYGLIVPSDLEKFPVLVYQVKIADFITLKHLPFEEIDAYDLRVGWSSENVQTPVGESEHSYCFSRLGRKASGNQFVDFGSQVSMDDVVTVALDLYASEMKIYVNEEDLGTVYKDLDFGGPGSVIYPHIGLKNLKVFVNFGLEQPEEGCKWELPPQLLNKNVKFIGQLERNPSILKRSVRPPDSKSDCTVLMMVGLPAAGKTFWVRHYLREHPNEHWVLLNTENVINLMKVNGVPRKRVHHGRWDMIMGLAAKALNRSFGLACRRRHNYIIDQTNVSRDARKRKLQVFKDFLRKCVVIVPPEEEFEHRQLRQARQETGSTLPAEALLELKATFALPAQDAEPIEDVIFVEPPIERVNEAIELIQRYNEEGRPYLRTKRYNNKPPPSVISDNRNQPMGSW